MRRFGIILAIIASFGITVGCGDEVVNPVSNNTEQVPAQQEQPSTPAQWPWTGTTWIAAGQSNMEWWGTFKDTDADVVVMAYSAFKQDGVAPAGSPSAWFSSSVWEPLNEAKAFSLVGGDFAIDLSAALAETVHIIGLAEGGTSVTCWMLDGECFEKNVRQFVGHRFDGVIWWQGESDAIVRYGGEYDLYEERFTTMIAQWREAFQDPNLPFFIVELQHYQESPDQDEPESCVVVREAQHRIAENVPDVFIVPTSDLTQSGSLHPVGIYPEVGTRLADKAAEYLSH